MLLLNVVVLGIPNEIREILKVKNGKFFSIEKFYGFQCVLVVVVVGGRKWILDDNIPKMFRMKIFFISLHKTILFQYTVFENSFIHQTNGLQLSIYRYIFFSPSIVNIKWCKKKWRKRKYFLHQYRNSIH